MLTHRARNQQPAKGITMRRFVFVTAAACLTACASAAPQGKSAIFLHPDGMGANTWTFVRLMQAGPDGALNWDQLPAVALYKGPMSDRVTATSNGGGTSHAWGVRVASNDFGTLDGAPIAKSRSGASMPLMLEAKAAGKAIGLVNSASITDAGTGTQIASVASRNDDAGIALQLFESGAEVLLGGGEAFFLPQGVTGRHGTGQRQDGRNLIEEAKAKGYVVVFTAAELAAVPEGTERLIGLFAAEETFNEGTEEGLRRDRRPHYVETAPRYAVMVEAAIKILSRNAAGYYLMAEEEATDNFGGENNAEAVLDAASGADAAIALALKASQADPNLTVLVASDSDCGGLQVTGDDIVAGQPVPKTAENGAPMDGRGGTGGQPFEAAPDRAGRTLPMAVAWASASDMSGGGAVRAVGPGAVRVTGTMDSTDVYAALYFGLFGKALD